MPRKVAAKKPAAGMHKMPGGMMMSDAEMKAMMAKRKMPPKGMARGGTITGYPENKLEPETSTPRRGRRRRAADRGNGVIPIGPPPLRRLAKGGTVKAKAKAKGG